MKERELPSVSLTADELLELEDRLAESTTNARYSVEVISEKGSTSFESFSDARYRSLLLDSGCTGYNIRLEGAEGKLLLHGTGGSEEQHSLLVDGDSEWEENVTRTVSLHMNRRKNDYRELISNRSTLLLVGLSVIASSYFTTLLPGIQMIFPPGLLSYLTFLLSFGMLLFVYRRNEYYPYIFVHSEIDSVSYKDGFVDAFADASLVVVAIVLLRLAFGRRLFDGLGIDFVRILL